MPSHHFTPSSNAQRMALAGLTVAALVLSGCSANFGDIATSGPETPAQAGVSLTGNIHGGQNPISSATVQLYAAGTTGYGSAATPLFATPLTTDANGGFSTTQSYTCPTNGEIYIVASGGNPGLGAGVTNAAITLMAAIGTCANLTATPFIQINEVTTVAAIWALQQFAGTTGTAMSASSTTASDNIGTTSTNIQGLANAFQTARVLASPSTGLSPGSDTSSNQTNVEYWHLNTLANIIASCINTNGASTGPTNATTCYTLFNNATSNGTGTGTIPADTFQAALYMAKNPTANVSALAALSSSSAPFQPTDATSVNDFTVGVSYSTSGHDSRWIAIDQYGNAWITTSGASIVELDPTGNVISTPTSYTPSGGSSTTIGTSYEVAVDTANNAWFTDETKFNIFEVDGSTSAGGANGGVGNAVSVGGSSDVEAIVVDGSNNVWASVTGGHIVGLLSGAYTTLVTGASVTTSPFGMAVDMSNQTKFGNSTLSNGGSFIYAVDSGGCATNITVDGATGQGGGSIAMAYTTGNGSSIAAGATTPLSYIVDVACNNTTNVANGTNIPGGTASTARVMMASPYGVAFDNSNDMWIVNQNYTSGTTSGTADTSSGHYSLTKVAAQNYGGYSAFTGAQGAANYTFTSISGVTGGLNTPYYLAMDGASAAWVANSAGAGVSAFTNAGANISPASGFSGGVNGSSARSYNASRGIAVDGSGNVWVANTGATYVTVLVGAATPTVTPLALGIKNGTLASKP